MKKLINFLSSSLWFVVVGVVLISFVWYISFVLGDMFSFSSAILGGIFVVGILLCTTGFFVHDHKKSSGQDLDD